MTKNQFCVFCGKKPENKNKEHVLPEWLIALTGDRSRVVNFGMDYESGKTIRFSRSTLVAPSCEVCNSAYSDLEDKVKPIIESLTASSNKSKNIRMAGLEPFDAAVSLLSYDSARKNETEQYSAVIAGLFIARYLHISQTGCLVIFTTFRE